MTGNASRRTRLTIEALEDRLLLSAGFLDPTFAGDGIATTQVGAEEYAHDVAVYAPGTANAGKVVVAGGAQPIGGGGLDVALVRYNPDGSLDPSFGKGGTVRLPLANKAEDQAMTVALVGDKILVGGYVIPGSLNGEFALARFNADGTLDTTFGSKGSGKVLTDFGRGGDYGLSMAVQADGKIVLGGLTTNPSTGYTSFAVARYNSSGTLDSTFGTGGKVIIDVGESLRTGTDRYMDLALSGDKIVLVGSASTGATATNDLYVVQLTANGQLDPNFGSGGIARPGQGYFPQVAVQPDGKLVVSSNLNRVMNVTRLLPNGAADTGFGTGGTASLPSPYAVGGRDESSGVAIDAFGRIVIGGWRNLNSGTGEVLTARFNSDGTLDQTFGVGGVNTTGSTVTAYTSPNSLVGLTLQPDGKPILVATRANNWAFVAARFLSDSALTAASTAPSHHTATITASDAQPLLDEALQRWAAEGADVSSLAGLTLHVADLGGNTLGLATPDSIWLDDNAAGWGWFVDPTPADDSEFTTPGNQGEKQRMDLLSVLMHEVGHLLDYTHQTQGLMAPTLQHGQRLVPTL